MKRIIIIIIMVSIMSFIGCSKEDEGQNLWENIITTMSESQFSAMEIMIAADFWTEVRTHHYTEPNGKGDEYISFDGESQDGQTLKTIAFKNNQFIKYISNTAIHRPYYVNYSMDIVGEDMYSLKNESISGYFKILAYDDNNLIIETDLFSIIKSSSNGNRSYPYSIIHFKRQFAQSPDWADKYVSYDEYLEGNN